MSQNRNHLLPTIIVNKNGVSTTVHRKPSPAPASITMFPLATLPTSGEDRQRLIKETAEALTRQNSEPPLTELDTTLRAQNYQSLLTVLPAFGNESLRRFAATAGTDLGWDLNEFLRNTTPDEEYVNDWLTIEPTALKDGIDSVRVIHGFPKYENLTPQQDGHYPPRRAEEVLAITRVAIHLMWLGHGIDYGVNDQDLDMEFIENPQLRDLLTTHENPGAVADLIIQRDIVAPDQITSLLEGKAATANAIHDGIL